MDHASLIYELTSLLPPEEKFGLASQLRRCSVSISSNIAEGSKRSSRADFRHFCKIALGSSAESETQLVLLSRLYPAIDTKDATNLLAELQKMLSSLYQSLSTTSKKPRKELH